MQLRVFFVCANFSRRSLQLAAENKLLRLQVGRCTLVMPAAAANASNFLQVAEMDKRLRKLENSGD